MNIAGLKKILLNLRNSNAAFVECFDVVMHSQLAKLKVYFFLIFLYLDVDECCNLALNTCQHICKNTIGSYYCECNEGYMLQSDYRTCESMLCRLRSIMYYLP